MGDATGALTHAERARAAHEVAAKRAQVARVRVSLFTERDGGVAVALERCLHLQAVAKRTDHALARVVAGQTDTHNPRALHAHVMAGAARLGKSATLSARAFDTTRQLTHALPPGVFAALPLAREQQQQQQQQQQQRGAMSAEVAAKHASSSAHVRRESYAEAVANDVQASIVAQARRLSIAAP